VAVLGLIKSSHLAGCFLRRGAGLRAPEDRIDASGSVIHPTRVTEAGAYWRVAPGDGESALA
jgi:hypothetical protein